MDRLIACSLLAPILYLTKKHFATTLRGLGCSLLMRNLRFYAQFDIYPCIEHGIDILAWGEQLCFTRHTGKDQIGPLTCFRKELIPLVGLFISIFYQALKVGCKQITGQVRNANASRMGAFTPGPACGTLHCEKKKAI